VARNDRGIALASDHQMGNKLGVNDWGLTLILLRDAFLLDHGIDREKVKIIDMKPDEMADALGAGRVDAVPHLTQRLPAKKRTGQQRNSILLRVNLHRELLHYLGMQGLCN